MMPPGVRGGTSLGTKAVMAAEPDGYTLLLTSSNVHVIGQTLNRNITLIRSRISPQSQQSVLPRGCLS
jgi:hypothetical protein